MGRENLQYQLADDQSNRILIFQIVNWIFYGCLCGISLGDRSRPWALSANTLIQVIISKILWWFGYELGESVSSINYKEFLGNNLRFSALVADGKF